MSDWWVGGTVLSAVLLALVVLFGPILVQIFKSYFFKEEE